MGTFGPAAHGGSLGGLRVSRNGRHAIKRRLGCPGLKVACGDASAAGCRKMGR